MTKILVIMAAGMGSRFGGDKQLTGVGPSGEILLEYSVFDAIHAGFDKIIFVIRPGMEDYFHVLTRRMKNSYGKKEFYYSIQGGKNSFDGIALPAGRVKPLGTVHAVLSAREHLTSHFAVINADDYYGPGSYKKLIEAMESFDEPQDAALITYALKNTLSSHGAVTRGICEISQGKLCNIRESYKVISDKHGVIIEKTELGENILPPDTPVSMNMWAFNVKALPYIEDYLTEFLDSLEADDNNTECLLPVMAADLMRDGKLIITTHQTDERWFGLTYRLDADDAAWELDKRHHDGHYPQKLF